MPNGYRLDTMFNTEHKQPIVYTEGPRDRLHYSATVAASTDDAVWKQNMADWYGLFPVRGNAWFMMPFCAHKLVGKKCPGRSGCPVHARYHRKRGHLWDHARAWRNRAGELVFTLEPWGDPLKTAVARMEMEKELAEIGVAVSYEGRSPYGASFILFLTDVRTEDGQRARMFQNGWRAEVGLPCL